MLQMLGFTFVIQILERCEVLEKLFSEKCHICKDNLLSECLINLKDRSRRRNKAKIMFRQLAKLTSTLAKGSSIQTASFEFNRAVATVYQPQRFFSGQDIVYRNQRQGYFIDPEDVSRRFIKLLASHDKIKNPHQITLETRFYEMGINDLSLVEIMLEAEQEFFLEFPDDDVERFKTVRDVVEYVSRSFFAK